MADFGILIAEKLVETIASEVIKEICTFCGYESQLEDLKKTVTTIQKVLLDAEAKRELSNEKQQFISELKYAVYDADDLFDEFRTLAELNQIQPLTKRGRLYKKVRRFFSSKNKLGLAYRMSRDVKDIKKRLDGIVDNHLKYGFIVDNHLKYGFIVDYKPIMKRSREETYSYVDANNIIGRDKDKEAIVDMLLNPNNNDVEDHFLAVAIVGVGGLGKTALAQLVYNDKRIENEFSKSRFWVCVSDQDGELFDVQTILCKILEILPKDGVDHQKLDGSSSMELVQQQFQERMRGKKYLLVLDDVWNEDHGEWLKLKDFLILGQAGSRVVVTTRSKMTGTIIGENSEKHAYELEGLSEDYSWRLFEMSAFGIANKPEKSENHQEFVESGKKIIAKCHNIPLALLVIGSLLFGQSIGHWQSLENVGLAQIDIDDKGNSKIMPILNLSYYNLEPSFKYCFGYCAMFPKDYEIKKQNLIDLWIAQGYVTPLNAGQCVEDAAEDHFEILLRRCFFQDVKKDQYGEIMSVKIHDLMHDVALEVGREEFCVETSLANIAGDKIRHVRYDGDTTTLESHLGIKKIRSFICQHKIPKVIEVTQFKILPCLLRALELHGDFEKLPGSIGELLHLRYLNLSYNQNLKVLPKEITRLHNLQTLLLSVCSSLQELPGDFSKLVNLRHLDLRRCEKLQCMPLGMGKVTSLKVLPYYVVGKSDGRDGLKVLKALTGIRGGMKIEIGKNYKEEVGVDEREGVGGYLKGMKHLKDVEIKFDWELENQEAVLVKHEDILVNLEPPSNVMELRISGYEGKTIPKWGRAMDNSSLSNLVQISLRHCSNLEETPVLSRRPHLKSLYLYHLDKLEYMEMVDIKRSDGGTKSSSEELGDTLFFPSLVTLKIHCLKNLKGWWKKSSGVDDCSSNMRLEFPRLSELMICDCPNLTLILLCPRIERLELRCNNRSLQVIGNTTKAMDDNNAGTSQQDLKLREFKTDNIDHLKSLPLSRLAYLQISQIEEEVGEVKKVESTILEVLASSLQTLEVDNMKTLRRLCGETWLQHFTALEKLTLLGNHVLVEEEKEEEENAFEQCSFPPNLRSLEFKHCNTMKSLPKGMQCLTSLRTLSLFQCSQLKHMPEWISCLSSLKSLTIFTCTSLKSLPQAMDKLTSLQCLEIISCGELEERCKEPVGMDYPKIKHIPNICLIGGICDDEQNNEEILSDLIASIETGSDYESGEARVLMNDEPYNNPVSGFFIQDSHY